MAQYKTYASLSKTQIEKESQKDFENDGHLVLVTSEQYRADLIKSNTITIIYHYADWCSPCKEIAGDYGRLSLKYSRPGMVSLSKEDVDDEIGNSAEPVHAVPCFHFYLRGVYQKRLTVTGANLGEVEQNLNVLLTEQQTKQAAPPVPSQQPVQINRTQNRRQPQPQTQTQTQPQNQPLSRTAGPVQPNRQPYAGQR